MAILSQTEKTKQLSLTSSLTRDTSSILLGESLMCGPHIHHDPVFFSSYFYLGTSHVIVFVHTVTRLQYHRYMTGQLQQERWGDTTLLVLPCKTMKAQCVTAA